MRGLLLVSPSPNSLLPKRVAQQLGVELAKLEIITYPSGEKNVKFIDPPAGKAVFVIQSHYPSPHEQIMSQALAIAVAKKAGAKRIFAVCPFLAYGREAKLNLLVQDLLMAAGAERVFTFDLHWEALGAAKQVTNLPAAEVFIERIKTLNLRGLAVVAPDAGAGGLATVYSRRLGCPRAVIHKQRTSAGIVSKLMRGEVRGRDCLLVDDMIDTGASAVAAAEVLKAAGAKKIFLAATHGLFSGATLDNLVRAPIERIFISDSLEPPAKIAKIEVLSLAPLLAAAIKSAAGAPVYLRRPAGALRTAGVGRRYP